MLTKKSAKKQVCEHVSHSGLFRGYLERFWPFWTFFFVHFYKIHPRFQTILPLTLTFLLFITPHFLTPFWQLIFSFTTIKLKISVRSCGGWSHDLDQKLKGFLQNKYLNFIIIYNLIYFASTNFFFAPSVTILPTNKGNPPVSLAFK